MKDFSKFYTPPLVARLLIELCGELSPRKIVDICAGSWNLLNEAKNIWPDSDYVGVDVDNRSQGSIKRDGRIFANEALEDGVKYDLVLANPPFQYESLNSEIIEIINARTEDYDFGGSVLNRLESTMMIFNSLLVNQNGVLASVVPLSMINSRGQNRLRTYLASNFSIKHIVRLPDSAFGSKEIRTAVVVMVRRSGDSPTLYSEAHLSDGIYITSELGWISKRFIREGIWDFTNDKGKLTNSTLGFKVYRNSFSTSDFTIEGSNLVIHSSSISSSNKFLNFKSITKEKISNNHQPTQVGDIVMTRVGKKCGDFAVITKNEEGLFTSDCIFIIRPENAARRKSIIRSLMETNIHRLSKGVVVKYITKDDLTTILS